MDFCCPIEHNFLINLELHVTINIFSLITNYIHRYINTGRVTKLHYNYTLPTELSVSYMMDLKYVVARKSSDKTIVTCCRYIKRCILVNLHTYAMRSDEIYVHVPLINLNPQIVESK